MHVILICTSVIIQLYSVLSVHRVIDVTNMCLSREEYDFFLTMGIGSFDSKALMISTEKPINCSLSFYIMNDNYVLTVIEIPDWHFHNKLCFQENPPSITVSQYNGNQTCTAITPGPRRNVLYKTRVKIIFQNINTVHTIKIIATSLRDPGLYKCRSKEIKCVVMQRVFCMSSEFMCDGDANCGVPNEYDEDLATCKGFGVTYFMIFSSIVMCIMSLLLLALLFLSLSPKRKETFVYKFDNSLPLFDSDTGVVNYEIDVQVLFPRGSAESVPKVKSILKKNVKTFI